MNIQQFQYILSLAEHRHFETAAGKCFISQSTLSTMVSKFEDEMGISIFDRKSKPVEITKEGALIIGQLKIISYEIAQLTELVKEIKGELKGQIKIGCIPTVAPFLLPLFLPDLSKDIPEMLFEVREVATGEIIRQLKSRELDIGIVSTPLDEKELLEYPIYKEAFTYFDTSQSSEEKISVNEVRMDNFWLMEEGHCMRDQVLDICKNEKRKISPSPNINFKAGSMDSLIRFVKANKGRTLLPYLTALNLSKEDKKHIGYFKNPVPFRNIGLITHQHFTKKRILGLLEKKIIGKIKSVSGIKIERQQKT